MHCTDIWQHQCARFQEQLQFCIPTFSIICVSLQSKHPFRIIIISRDAYLTLCFVVSYLSLGLLSVLFWFGKLIKSVLLYHRSDRLSLLQWCTFFRYVLHGHNDGTLAGVQILCFVVKMQTICILIVAFHKQTVYSCAVFCLFQQH